MTNKTMYYFDTEQSVAKEVKKFKRFLKNEELAENSIIGYTWTLQYFLTNYVKVDENTLFEYKNYLVANFAPATANQRIQALNKYLKFINSKHHLKSVKIQQKPFLENVISMQDYNFLKRKLKKDNPVYYFLIWGMACTGARISEILCVKAEHIIDGQMDFYGKGKKYRRIYFIKQYQRECLNWLEKIECTSGYIFVKEDGCQLSIKGVEKKLKTFAKEYAINPEVMYPHSFRHLFGKTFYESCHDLPLLADLMGHASLDTTRVYSRRTSSEQYQIVNKIVTW